MIIRKLTFFFYSLLTAFCVLSCAGGPNLAKYPQREIDRPATVPDGLNKWYIQSQQLRSKDDFSQSYTNYDINPFRWETSLNDNWSLIWSPLPFGVVHQFWNTERSRFSFLTFMGAGYGTISGLKLSPTLELSYRLKLTKDFGFDFDPFFTSHISFKDGERYRWSSGFEVGPLFQVNDTVAVKPVFLYSVFRGRPFIDADNSQDDQTHYRTGAGIKGSV